MISFNLSVLYKLRPLNLGNSRFEIVERKLRDYKENLILQVRSYSKTLLLYSLQNRQNPRMGRFSDRNDMG